MKRTFLTLFLSFLVYALTMAKNVDVNTAINVARNFYTTKALISHALNKEDLVISLAYACKADNTNSLKAGSEEILYYIFNVNTNDGFVIVSADDVVSPIIGYASEGTYSGKNLPPSFQSWMDGYKKQILFVKTNKIEATGQIRTEWNDLIYINDKNLPVTPAGYVYPLTQTTWDQSPYVNALCPGGSVTGCVATAMAQIMKFWNYPPHGYGTHSYTDHNYGVQYVDFATTNYNWPAMVTAVSSANPAIATLMYSCGVSVNMSYSPSGSGAYVTSASSPVQNCSEYAYKTYFGYDQNTVRGLEYSNYTYQAFQTILMYELAAGRPVQYAGDDTVQGGHSWVCDGYDVNDFFHMNWGWSGMYNSYFDINALNPASYAFNNNQEVIIGIQPDTNPPVAKFAAVDTSSTCSGIVQFNDSSQHYPVSWRWDFGDGVTDTVQNPVHTYTISGTYTVKLKISNSYGSDSLIKVNYISVSVPAMPVTVPTSVTFCDSGSTTLSATGGGTIAWYDAPAGGNVLGTGSSLITPLLTTTTIYYVDNETYSTSVYGGKPDNTGGGGNNTSASNYLIFDCYTPLTLISVDVYANSTGLRTIELKDNTGAVLKSDTVTIQSTGLNTITLNFLVPIGTSLQLGLAPGSLVDLYRNNAGVNYPYTTQGLLSITGSSAGSSRYYFFYNWQIQGSACTSARVPVTVNVYHNPVVAFNDTLVSGNINFINNTTGATSYVWNFGDGDTSTQVNPSHTYETFGNYTVTLTATNSCGQGQLTRNINFISTGIENASGSNNFEVFPNPGNGIVNIKVSPNDSKEIRINVYNIEGKKVYFGNYFTGSDEFSKAINLSYLEKGLFHLQIISGSKVWDKIIIIQ